MPAVPLRKGPYHGHSEATRCRGGPKTRPDLRRQIGKYIPKYPTKLGLIKRACRLRLNETLTDDEIDMLVRRVERQEQQSQRKRHLARQKPT